MARSSLIPALLVAFFVCLGVSLAAEAFDPTDQLTIEISGHIGYDYLDATGLDYTTPENYIIVPDNTWGNCDAAVDDIHDEEWAEQLIDNGVEIAEWFWEAKTETHNFEVAVVSADDGDSFNLYLYHDKPTVKEFDPSDVFKDGVWVVCDEVP